VRWTPTRAVVVAASALVWIASPIAGPTQGQGRTSAIALGLTPRAIAASAEVGERPPPVLPGTVRQVVRWRARGLLRELVDVAPADQTRRLPLVVVLHGRWQTPWRAERVEGWDRYAATGQAVIAYGAGYGGSWNAGRCCGPAARAQLDDVAFVRTAIRLEEGRHAVDRRRVFLVGFSNGGMLAYDVACEQARLISAVAVVAGALERPSCVPSRALSVIDVQGGRDRVVPFAGAAFSAVAGAPIASVASSLRPWRQVAHGQAVVHLVRLDGLGHEWPTRREAGWDGTSQIWHFLVTHPAQTS
jgi:poly(3-hydroxybutyrate) depolymerase